MGDLSDTPRQRLQPRVKHALVKTALAGATLLLSTLSWGVVNLPVGHVGSLAVEIQFDQLRTFDKASGSAIFPNASAMVYRVTVMNQGTTSVSKVELQSWVAASAASCAGEVEPLRNAPGAAFSPVQSLPALSPGESRTYEVSYTPGPCSFDGEVKISVRYVDEMRKFISALLDSPIGIQIR